MTQQTKWFALCSLVTLWSGLLYVYVIDVAPPIEVPLKYQSGQPVANSQPTSAGETWEVQSLRAQTRELPLTPKRNLFTAANIAPSSNPEAGLRAQQKKQQQLNAVPPVPPTPLTPPPPTPEELARQQEALAAQAARQQQELAAQAALQQEQMRRQQLQEQMGQYRYLGYVNQNSVHKAFLGKGRELYILRQGDSVEGKFRVSRIEATHVTLQDTDAQVQTTLKLKKEEMPEEGPSGFPQTFSPDSLPPAPILMPAQQDPP